MPSGQRNSLKVTYTHEEDLLPPIDPALRESWPVWFAWAGVLGLIVLVTHLPMLAGKLTELYQDDVNFLQNRFLFSGRGWIGIWRFPHSQFAQFSPLGYSLLWFQWQLVPAVESLGVQNFGYYLGGLLRVPHFVNVALHLGNVLLLWTLLKKLDIKGAFLAAAVFAVHPLGVESVQWISAQPLLLGTFLGLSSLIVYLRFCGVNPPVFDPMAHVKLPASRTVLYILALTLFILALLAKPWLAILPLILLVIIWWERGTLSSSHLKPLAPFLLLSALTLAGAIFVLQGPANATNFLDVRPIEKLSAAGRGVWSYLLGILVPYPLAFAYPRWMYHPLALGLIPLALAALYGLWALRKTFGRAIPAAGALYLLSILPAILYFNEANLRGAFIADFCAYLALAVVATGIASLLAWKFSPEEISADRPAPWIAGAALTILAGYSIYLSLDYRKPEDLLATAAAHYPRAHFARVAIANLKLSRRDANGAMDEYNAVLKDDPQNRSALLGVASILFSREEYGNAMGMYLQVLRRYPSDPEAMIQLSLCHLSLGDSNRAMLEAQSVVDQNPESVDAVHNLAVVAQARGEYDLAIQSFTRAIDLAPQLPNSRLNRASLYFQLGDPDKAEADIMAILRNNPGNYEAIFNAASMCAALGSGAPNETQRDILYDRAEAAYRTAISIRPDSPIGPANLGKLLLLRHKFDEASHFFRIACELEPDNTDYARLFQQAKDLAK
jgi:tetratricopeptide (TPR) repeat protein